MAPPYVYLPLVCPLVHMAAGKSRVERGDPGGEKPGWGQPSIYFPIGDHVNVSWCCSHTNASGVISTSHIVASHITKLLLSFRQILQFRF